MAYINEGKPPFILDLEHNQKVTKKEARDADRKYYGLEPLRSKLRKPCRECGRKTACNHRSFTAQGTFNPDKPQLLEPRKPCTSCGTPCLESATFCTGCNLPDPFKPRKSRT